MVVSMENVPPDLIETVQGLAAEGLPADEIAFMTHASVSLVRQILDQPSNDKAVNTTPERE